MDDKNDRCVLCNNHFTRRVNDGKLERRSISSNLRVRGNAITASRALSYLYKLDITDSGNFLCSECFAELEKKHRLHKPRPPVPVQLEPVKRPLLSSQSSTPIRTKHVKLGSSPSVTRSPLYTSTPKARNRCPSLKSTHGKRSMTQGRAAKSVGTYVQYSMYKPALLKILESGKAARNAFRHVMQQEIRDEIQKYVAKNSRCEGIFPKLTSSKDIENFSWSDLIHDFQDIMPTLTAAFLGAMPAKIKGESSNANIIHPRLGFMVSIALYTHRPQSLQFVQSLNGIQMWRSGASQKLFKCFNHLGICQSSGPTRKNIDMLVAESDAELMKWKNAVQQRAERNSMMNSSLHDQLTCAFDTDDTTDVTVRSDDDELLVGIENVTIEFDSDYEFESDGSESSLSESCGNITEESCALNSGNSGYALVWDNTQKLVHARNQSRGSSNKMLLWANSYAALNRVDCSHLRSDGSTLKAAEIPLNVYLPNSEDYQALRHRMTIIVSRILTDHIRFFRENFGKKINKHILHTYSDESAERSQMANIGIIDENPSSVAGTIAIMATLHKYVAQTTAGNLVVVPTHGDCLAVERMVDSKRARAADHNQVDRLEGLEPVPQEFHHRGLMLQDLMNLLFNGKSIGERGTLSQLRNEFGHRNVTTDVMNSFNHVENFTRFCTEAHVIYLALQLCGMDDINDDLVTIAHLPDEDSRLSYFNKICEKLVDEVWLLPNVAEINNILDIPVDQTYVPDVWCSCEQDRQSTMIRCSNANCPLGTWFHAECLHVESIPAKNEDWWCSVGCERTKSSIFCKCQTIKQGPIVHCARGTDCTNGMRFHLKCLHLKHTPENPWYCSRECSQAAGKLPDHVRNYALAVLFYGLIDLCHRDAIREGDGLALMTMWRVNMLRFWNGHHYKYFNAGHRLLAGTSGWWSPRIIEEVIHNRTVNITGGMGKNVAMDRACEFLNAQFKETLQYAHGTYTTKTINRAGKIVGAVARSVDAAFHEHVCETDVDECYHSRYSYHDDIKAFVTEYRADKLFDCIPGRHHKTFPAFSCDISVTEEAKMKQRLLTYSQKLDRMRVIPGVET